MSIWKKIKIATWKDVIEELAFLLGGYVPACVGKPAGVVESELLDVLTAAMLSTSRCLKHDSTITGRMMMSGCTLGIPCC